MVKLGRKATIIPTWSPTKAEREAGAREIDLDWLCGLIRSYGLHCSERARFAQRNEDGDIESAAYRDKAAGETLEAIERALYGRYYS